MMNARTLTQTLTQTRPHTRTQPHHTTPRHATPRHATPRHATPRHATRARTHARMPARTHTRNTFGSSSRSDTNHVDERDVEEHASRHHEHPLRAIGGFSDDLADNEPDIARAGRQEVEAHSLLHGHASIEQNSKVSCNVSKSNSCFIKQTITFQLVRRPGYLEC